MAIKPEHLSSIVKASDLAGRDMVDHGPDLAGPNTDSENLYRSAILHNPQPVPKRPGKTAGEGISKKVVFEVPGDSLHGPGTKFMVKPYHERVIQRVKKWMHAPIQGWSEQTNQALYHAGGIGDLHQKVHVSEHNMGPGYEREPALAVQLHPGLKPIRDDSHYVLQMIHGHDGTPDPDYEDAHKIGLMDFLSNNLDRHGGNVMRKPEGGLLALDHSRSFQYKSSRKLSENKNRDESEDSPGRYVARKGDWHYWEQHALPTRTGGRTYDEKQANRLSWGPAFDWWGQNSGKIRAKMAERVKQIKDPRVRDHIMRNFDTRADHLDSISRDGVENWGDDWHTNTVPMYRPGQLTDRELAEKDWKEGNG